MRFRKQYMILQKSAVGKVDNDSVSLKQTIESQAE